jgi:CelD/BcsL family acetyltransferase involved in cellulose biosynthesis
MSAALGEPADNALAAIAVRVLTPAQVDSQVRASWLALEAQALEPNAYLSPHFVLPALEYLDAPTNAQLLFAWQGDRMVAAGVFEPVLGTRHFPVPHLAAWRSRHSFVGGILLHRDCAVPALQALMNHVHTNPWRYQGIDFGLSFADGAQAQRMQQCLQTHAVQAQAVVSVQRAVLRRESMGQAGLAEIAPSRQADMRRQWRRLQQRGALTWQAARPNAPAAGFAQRFLDLENLGWKKEQGTALACNPKDQTFFNALVENFASEERMLFTELCLDGRAIASTVNMISGNAAFAFKVGSDPEYKSYAPGLVNEWEFVHQAQRAVPEAEFMDSGAAPGSYIENYWLHRRPMSNMVAATTAAGAAALGASDAARAFKRSAWLNLAVPIRDLSTALIAFV